MKLFSSFILLSLAALTVYAQPNPDTLWTTRIGGAGIDYCHAIQQTADGGYILAGETNSFGAHTTDAYLVKLNSAGSVQWSETYGAYSEFSNSKFVAFQPTADQGYILVGMTHSGNWVDMYVVKTDGDGDTVWTRVFNDPRVTINVFANGVLQTSDHGYLIAGSASSTTGGYICLIRTGAGGDTIWTRFMRERQAIAFEACNAIIPASDGGYMLAGNRYVEESNNIDALLMKVTAAGAVEWWDFYGHESQDEFGSIEETVDGGYILAGRSYVSASQGFDIYVVRTTSSGDTVWTRRFGGTGEDVAVSVHETSDGFVVGGQTRSYGAGNADFYLIKLNANGEQLWSRTWGGSGWDYCEGMQLTSDGGFVLGGWTSSFSAQVYDLYVVKTGPDQPGGGCPQACADAYPITLGDTVNQCSFHEDGHHWFRIQLAPGQYRFQLNGFSGSTDYDIYTWLNCGDPSPTACGGLAVGPEDFECQIVGGTLELYIDVDTYQGPYGPYWLLISNAESADREEASVPKEYALSAYPNPFNPVTTVAFALPQTGAVRLVVYDVAGRLVQTLLDKRVEAGRHEVVFDGQALPSGVYFAQIRIGAFLRTQKLILLK